MSIREKIPLEEMIRACLDMAEFYDRQSENFKMMANANPAAPARKAKVMRSAAMTLDLVQMFEGQFVAMVKASGGGQKGKK